MRVCDMCKSYEALHLYTYLFVVVLQNVMHSRCEFPLSACVFLFSC